MATLESDTSRSFKGKHFVPWVQPPPLISTGSKGTPTVLAFSIHNPEGDMGAAMQVI